MEAYLIFFSLFFGAAIGSFLNCLVFRLADNESLMGRSHCRACNNTIHWYDNLPVISWLLLRGKCRHCQDKISWQYPLLELAASLLFALVTVNHLGLDINSLNFYLLVLRDWLIVSILLFVLVYDARFFMISVNVLIFGALALILIFLFLGISWGAMILAFFIGLGFFALQYLITRGRGIGEGDIWLGAFMGLALADWKLLLVALFLSYVIGAAVGLGLMASGSKGMKDKLPLGVFLAIGGILTIFFGAQIISWYGAFLY